MTLRILSGLGEISSDYDGFILDLWGVLHDGSHPFPGAVEALTRLKAAGKRTVVLSNAPRRAEDGSTPRGRDRHSAKSLRRHPFLGRGGVAAFVETRRPVLPISRAALLFHRAEARRSDDGGARSGAGRRRGAGRVPAGDRPGGLGGKPRALRGRAEGGAQARSADGLRQCRSGGDASGAAQHLRRRHGGILRRARRQGALARQALSLGL